MKGLNTYNIKKDELLAESCLSISGLCYGNRISKKDKKIHIVISNRLGVSGILPVAKRCECGGHTWSTIWGGDKFVCHHCGKQYFAKEFDQLPEEGLLRSQAEDRRIFAMLLDGGDLREHPEKSVLVLKNYAGIPEGELPIAYAEHLAKVYKNASVVTLYHKSPEVNRQNITVTKVRTTV